MVVRRRREHPPGPAHPPARSALRPGKSHHPPWPDPVRPPPSHQPGLRPAPLSRRFVRGRRGSQGAGRAGDRRGLGSWVGGRWGGGEGAGLPRVPPPRRPRSHRLPGAASRPV